MGGKPTVAILDAMVAPAANAPQTSLASGYEALLKGCGLIDRSARGKLALDGPDAVDFLNGQVTNQLADLRSGEGCYAAFLTPKGKMLGDLRILAAGTPRGEAPTELLLDTERVALQALFDLITRFKIGYRVQLHKRTLEFALLSLIGPLANDVLAGVGAALPPGALDRDHHHMGASIEGLSVRLIATASPPGVDLLCATPQAPRLGAALQAAGATAVEEADAEIVRVEQGIPRYGIDLDESVIPQEAGLNERAVSFVKGCYVGQETVARLHYRGKPNRHLRGLRLSQPTPPQATLELAGRELGVLTSSVVSPRLGPIGLALVRREAPPGTVLDVAGCGGSAEVLALPFEPQPR
jgi:folate-binding protein YgfZ